MNISPKKEKMGLARDESGF